MKTIYLDHAAGTPVDDKVVDGMIPYLKGYFGNPQSIHVYGEEAKGAIEAAREVMADLISADPGEIYFTANGTESNNIAIKGIAHAAKKKGSHIVVSAIEHQSVLHSVKSLVKEGFSVTHVPVDKHGVVSLEDVKKAMVDETILVSIMHANSEVGTIEPIGEIAKVAKERGAIFHTDAVSAVGNIPVDVNKLGVDSLSLSGSQFYGPKGAAALYLKKGTRIVPFIDGGIQEDGRRPGTENVPGIVGLGLAARLAKDEMADRAKHLTVLRDALISGLTSKIDHIYLTGHPEKRLPGHASFVVEFIEGEAMLLSLSMEGVCVASGSACTSKALKASHVLEAMKVETALAQGSIVFSFGMMNTMEDVDYVLEVFPPIIERLRKMSPLYTKYLKEGKK
ncbi:MAG: cysteine desulfurase [Deltaproteobacteria bacterium]|uniref:Cysteine desulfurase n=1 Tax=Candidatus Zymogenus saltonus TaxID=2844893 RepID=A0A9D8PNZ4_9DELT|nr:cysteine desulfurase [Candidatus Zymogenus saltonus]